MTTRDEGVDELAELRPSSSCSLRPPSSSCSLLKRANTEHLRGRINSREPPHSDNTRFNNNSTGVLKARPRRLTAGCRVQT